jgi:myo-inositol-hexaphosphate 3-phosphohydrolase
MNYGNFEGTSALSWSAMGVLGYDVFSRGDRVAVSGGFGVGFEDGNDGWHGSSGDDVWGGRVGAQWTWGRKPVPYVLK